MATKTPYVAIFVGHGKSTDGSWDPGAVYGKYEEADLMLDICKSAVKYLKISGIKTLSDAEEDNNINAAEQVRQANAKKVDIFVSLHADWYKAPSGTLPLYVSDSGKKIAKAINKAVMEDMDMPTRGLSLRKDLYELNATNMPACIFETGSLKADLADLRNADDYGKAIARGICNYFGVTFKEGDFKVKTKGKLIVRKTSALTSVKTGTTKKGYIYTIVDTNKAGTRGKLKSGLGWITITDKYVSEVK